MKRYAISDIHGCAKTFKALLKKIQFTTEDELYLLGDYIDRGPDSKGVIDHIWQLQKEGYSVHCLRGNHEQMLVDSFHNPSDYYKGEQHCLASFGVSSDHKIPKVYIHWMERLSTYFEVGDYILVHAGLSFEDKNPLDNQQEMIWIRHWYETINMDWLGTRIIVHGHTPTQQLVIKNSVKTLQEIPAINIDNGCVYNAFAMGNLCALELGTNRLYFQPRIG